MPNLFCAEPSDYPMVFVASYYVISQLSFGSCAVRGQDPTIGSKIRNNKVLLGWKVPLESTKGGTKAGVIMYKR